MIKIYDKVKIKDIGIIGRVIDTSIRDGRKYYTVEADEKTDVKDSRRITDDDVAIFDCASGEIEPT